MSPALAVASDLLTLEEILDLVDAKIDLISDYQLEYPGDYEPADLAALHAELDRLIALRDRLRARQRA